MKCTADDILYSPERKKTECYRAAAAAAAAQMWSDLPASTCSMLKGQAEQSTQESEIQYIHTDVQLALYYASLLTFFCILI